MWLLEVNSKEINLTQTEQFYRWQTIRQNDGKEGTRLRTPTRALCMIPRIRVTNKIHSNVIDYHVADNLAQGKQPIKNEVHS